MTLKYEYPFDPEATNSTASSIYQIARSAGGAVLDLGSGPGVVSRVLRAVDGRRVVCLDNDPAALEQAAEHGLETALTDLEQDDWVREQQDQRFDVVILADVLEHLRDPARLLRALAEHDVVAADGRLVVSVPNAAHQSVLAELLTGNFAYTETGILDNTHLRWFTLASLTALLEANGFVVARVRRTTRSLESTPSGHRAVSLPQHVRDLMSALGPDALTYQYVLECFRTTEGGRLAALRAQLDEVAVERLQERSTVRSLQEEVALQKREVEALRSLVQQERDLSRAEVEAGAAELEQLRRQLKENAPRPPAPVIPTPAELRLARIEKSRSYRAARLTARTARRVLGPALQVRRRLGGRG